MNKNPRNLNLTKMKRERRKKERDERALVVGLFLAFVARPRTNMGHEIFEEDCERALGEAGFIWNKRTRKWMPPPRDAKPPESYNYISPPRRLRGDRI
jgi:hypothetical protein